MNRCQSRLFLPPVQKPDDQVLCHSEESGAGRLDVEQAERTAGE